MFIFERYKIKKNSFSYTNQTFIEILQESINEEFEIENRSKTLRYSGNYVKLDPRSGSENVTIIEVCNV